MRAMEGFVTTRVGVPGWRGAVRVLHITDVHVCHVDRGDAHEGVQRKRAAQMRGAGCRGEAWARKWMGALGKGDFDAVILTGDLVDFISRSAVAAAKRLLDACRAPLYFVTGNHDWYVLTEKGFELADGGLREKRWAAVGELRPRAAARWEIKGLQFLGIDDAKYQISGEQVGFVKEHLATGQPTVLAVHIPLTQPRLKELTTIRWKSPILLGERFDGAERAKWQADPPARATGEFLRVVRRAASVRAILAGHVHFGFEERYSGTAVQLVGPPGYEGAFRVVEFVGE